MEIEVFAKRGWNFRDREIEKFDRRSFRRSLSTVGQLPATRRVTQNRVLRSYASATNSSFSNEGRYQ